MQKNTKKHSKAGEYHYLKQLGSHITSSASCVLTSQIVDMMPSCAKSEYCQVQYPTGLTALVWGGEHTGVTVVHSQPCCVTVDY